MTKKTMKGFSKDNLIFMKRFYLFYSEISEQSVQILENNCDEFVEQPVQQLQVIDNQEILKKKSLPL